ncbi:MAG: McrC family protein [Cocleimonas sp.]|nr:McrC family protein [Cocleimonas sp.]
MSVITLPEFGLLSCYPCDTNIKQIPRSAFLWLKQQALTVVKGKAQFINLIARHGIECLQVKNYVGVIETPCGTCIEVLPKITNKSFTPVQARKTLWKMLSVVLKLKALESHNALLKTTSKSLIEILIHLFLTESSHLLHKGLRSDYKRIQGQLRFIKGRLNITSQLRQPTSKQHHFCIEYDVFSSNRAENRLLKKTLMTVLGWSRDNENQRLARELLFLLDAIPESKNIAIDLSRWSTQRDMVHYQAVKPWIDLILRNHSPWFLSGSWQGVSMLFPMERLFESYVATLLKKSLHPEYKLVEQSTLHSLLQHKEKKMFQLRPDISIRKGSVVISILDAKWKIINSNSREKKYGLSQADMYQLYAYGQKYLQGHGELYLIYPKQASFQESLPRFDFDKKLSLWVIPFDLESDKFINNKDSSFNTFTN